MGGGAHSPPAREKRALRSHKALGAPLAPCLVGCLLVCDDKVCPHLPGPGKQHTARQTRQVLAAKAIETNGNAELATWVQQQRVCLTFVLAA